MRGKRTDKSKKTRMQAVLAMRKDGNTHQEIHQQTGVPLRTISRWLKKQRDLEKRKTL